VRMDYGAPTGSHIQERRAIVRTVKPGITSMTNLHAYCPNVPRVGISDIDHQSVSTPPNPISRRGVMLNALDFVTVTYGTLLVLHLERRAPVQCRHRQNERIQSGLSYCPVVIV